MAFLFPIVLLRYPFFFNFMKLRLSDAKEMAERPSRFRNTSIESLARARARVGYVWHYGLSTKRPRHNNRQSTKRS